MTARTAIAIVVVAYLLAGALWLCAAPERHSGAYELGVNSALNMTLLVGAEWRELGLRPTWAQLQAEVARRLNVKRNDPPWRKSK